MQNVKRKLVQRLDQTFPRLMGQARFQYHVGYKQSLVYPNVLGPLFKKLASQNMVAVDIGANRGIFSLYLCRHFKSCIAVEPIPQLAASLKRAAPRNLTVRAAAMGAKAGVITLRFPLGPDGAPLHALSSAADDNALNVFAKTGMSSVEVPQEKLDGISAGQGEIGFVKIDVEGYENLVLDGAELILSTHKPTLFIEVFRQYNKSYMSVFERLERLGYSAFRLSDSGLKKMTGKMFDEMKLQVLKLDGTDEIDYLFHPTERLDQLEGILAPGGT